MNPTHHPLLPPLADLLAAARVVRLPLRTRFRGITEREALLIQGPAGWGEFSPFLEYGAVEAARWLAAAIEAAYQGWPAPLRDRIEVNGTVPAVPRQDVAEVLARFPGCRTAKVKVAEPGQQLADDLDRVRSVRQVLGSEGLIRVDANGGWTVEEAERALSELAETGLQYAEQPCRTLTEMADLRRRLSRSGTPVLLAADESVRKAADPLRVAGLEAADIVVIKVPPLGGVRAALDVIKACGLPAVVSSALDTSVGLAAGLALAAALPELPYACGLGTAALLAGDVRSDSLLPVDGALRPGPALAEAAALQRYKAPPEREDWWRQRLAYCYSVVAGSTAG